MPLTVQNAAEGDRRLSEGRVDVRRHHPMTIKKMTIKKIKIKKMKKKKTMIKKMTIKKLAI